MPGNQKVIWSEGMFLRPQHFQQHDRFYEHWLQARCSPLQVFPWGFTELTIDTELLASGKFAIKTCKGVFPDGTPFNAPEQDPLPRVLEIPSDKKNEQILLALPLQRISSKEVQYGNEENVLARYHHVEMNRPDLHTREMGNDAAIEMGELATHLRFGGQDLGAYTAIPAAMLVEKNANGRVILDDSFIPSCLACSGSNVLLDYIEDILGLLTHRAQALAKRIGSPGAGGVAEVTDFLLLQIINRYEALFIHLTTSQGLHPESLFQTLLQIAGELATITRPERRPDSLPIYRHDDMTATFPPVIAAIRESLNWVREARAVPIPLQTHKYGIRTASVNDHELLANADFVLAVNADVPAEQLHRNFPKQTTIATAAKLRDLVMAHTSGIKIHVLNIAPRQIPYHAGFTYFKLDTNNELWKDLLKTGAIAMHFSGEYPGLKLEFWAIRGEAS